MSIINQSNLLFLFYLTSFQLCQKNKQSSGTVFDRGSKFILVSLFNLLLMNTKRALTLMEDFEQKTQGCCCWLKCKCFSVSFFCLFLFFFSCFLCIAFPENWINLVSLLTEKCNVIFQDG